MKHFFDWIRTKTFWLLSALITLFGGITTRFVNCGTNAVLVTNQIVSNPTSQLTAAEVASFVANWFYEGPEDPLPTKGVGGEIAKTFKPIVLRQSHELFNAARLKILGKMEFILQTSRLWKSKQIQQGARAIQKKIGHAEGDLTVSAFEGIKHTQENAEILINDIVKNADVIVIRPELTKIYNKMGQGLSILTEDASFKGLVEIALEKELKQK